MQPLYSTSLAQGKGYKEVYICQALKAGYSEQLAHVGPLYLRPCQAENHNYAYDMDSGLGWIKDFDEIDESIH